MTTRKQKSEAAPAVRKYICSQKCHWGRIYEEGDIAVTARTDVPREHFRPAEGDWPKEEPVEPKAEK